MSFLGIMKFLTVRAAEFFVVLLLILFMPNVPPHCKIRDSYSLTTPMPLEGKLTLNERLNDAIIWHKGELHGPEAFADYNGELYATLHGGDVVKLTGDHITPIVKFGKPCKGFYQEKICGRPLGMAFDKDGSLVVADAYYGIFRVNINTGEKIQLVSQDVEIDAKKPKLMNSVAISKNGDIYWTDSSTDFSLEDGFIDFLADGSGRLVHYNTKTKENTVLIDNLHFANGIALSENEDFIVVAETARNRLHRYYLNGPKKGTSDIFIDGLPGAPDNLKSDGQGGFLVPLVVPTDDLYPLPTQIFGPFPLIRKFIARIFGLTELSFNVIQQVYPNEYAERALHFVGHFESANILLNTHRTTVLHVSKTGEVIDSFHAVDKKISGISEAHIFKDELYLGSPFNDYIAKVPLNKLGLEHLGKLKQKRQTTSQTHPPAAATKDHPPVQAAPTPKPTIAPTQSTKQTPPTRAATTQKPITQKQTTTTAAPKTTPPPTKAQTTTPPPTKAQTTTPPPTKAQTTTPPPTKAQSTKPPPTKAQTTKPPPTTQTTTSSPTKAQTTTPLPAKAQTTTLPPTRPQAKNPPPVIKVPGKVVDPHPTQKPAAVPTEKPKIPPVTEPPKQTDSRPKENPPSQSQSKEKPKTGSVNDAKTTA